MRNRFVRLCVVLVLLASAAVAAYVVRGALSTSADGTLADLDGRSNRLLTLIASLRGAEAGYIVAGQDPTPAFEKFSTLLHEVTALTTETSSVLRSPDAQQELRTFAGATSRLAEADAAARAPVLIGDLQSASSAIAGAASQAADAMADAVTRMREAERAQQLAAAAAISTRNVTLLASVAGLWVLGLLLMAFVPVPSREATGKAAEGVPETTAAAGAILIAAAADLCTEISRVETTDALNELLNRALSVLEAEGLVVWMESGGELLAATAVGYPPDVKSRLSSIRREDDNMTASAWRQRLTEVVEGGEQSGAAIAVPLFSGQTCCGVFAVELRAGRQPDHLTRDVARMIAAQLATVVAGPVSSPSAVAAAHG
jgi:hypothetical protein